MRQEEFVMRGQTPSTSGKNTEVLNFSGFKPVYAYRLTEFVLFPSTDYLNSSFESAACITAGKTALDPVSPNFSEEGLIATAFVSDNDATQYPVSALSVINDTFLITQNLLLTVTDTGNDPVNWQCKFMPVKMTKAEEAVTNYKQFIISDE